jgi:hypothetical protein
MNLYTSEAGIILKKQVVRTLLYYDIFNYPLTSTEVFQFLGINSITEQDVIVALNTLAEDSIIFRLEEFYSVQPPQSIVQRRKKGNRTAKEFYTLAVKKAAFISKFPFVRAVLASGSLSKGYMDEKSDLDFFVVTAPKRLWIARTLLVTYKRFFLSNSHKYFCVNYFVDEDHLEIEEKNLFTATELATALPLYGSQYYERLMAVNTWLKDFFPNYISRPTGTVPASKTEGFKKILEWTTNLFFGDMIEPLFRQLTRRRWKRMYKKEYSIADFDIAFKSKEYASKNHPQHFQRKIIDLYNKKIEQFDFVSWQKPVTNNGVNSGIKN